MNKNFSKVLLVVILPMLTLLLGKFWGESSQTALPSRSTAENSARISSPSFESSKSALEKNGSPAQATKSEVQKLFSKSEQGGGDYLGIATTAIQDPNPVTRRLAFAELLGAMTLENADEIRAHLASLGVGGDEWRDFNYTWGALGGKAAFDQALLAEDKDLRALLSGWAAVDPAGAIALLSQLPADLEGERKAFEESIVSGLADLDFAQAVAFINQLEDQGRENASSLIGLVAGEVLRSGTAQEASLWANTLPAGTMRGEAMARIAGRFAREDSEAASKWITAHADQDYAARPIAEIGRTWGREEPAAAADWLQSLPQGEGPKNGLSETFSDWEDSNPTAAAEYLLAMPQSELRDSSISGFARGYAWQDPVTSLAWAADISDPALRERTLTETGQIYFERNPEEASQWIQSSGLPPEMQAAMRTPRERRRR